jgi:hypothetical protein
MVSYSFNNVTYSLAIKSAILLYVCVSLLSIVNTYIAIYLGGITIYIIYFIPVFAILSHMITANIFTSMFRAKLYIAWMLGFILIYIMFFQFIATKPEYIKFVLGINVNLYVMHLISIIPVIVMSWYVLQAKDINFNKLLTILIFSIYTINYVLTLNGLQSNELAVRTLSTGAGGEEYSLAGVSGFDITYSAVVLVPCILYLILRFNKLKRGLLIAFLVLTLIYIYECAFIIAILATALAVVVFAYSLVNKVIKVLLIISIVLIVIVAINPILISNILDMLSDIVSIEHLRKYKAIADMLMFGDTTALQLDRLYTYQMSIDAFVESPIGGIYIVDSTYKLSGHSTILDILGGCGLIGFVPFVIYFYYSYKYSRNYINDYMYKQCILSTYVVFAFIATLNPQLASPNQLLILLVINPIMCSTTEMHSKRTNIRANNSSMGSLRRRSASLRPLTVR